MDPISNLLGAWAQELTLGAVALRLAISVVFGAIAGCERAEKRHAAGLRTFILVSLAGAICMMLDVYLHSIYLLSAAAVIATAILSVNSVLYSSKSQIKGLTTSVALWACAAIGLASGAGLYTVALLGFVALLCCLRWFPPFETYLKNRSNHFEIHLELTSSSHLQDFVTTLRRLGMRIDDIESNPAYLKSGLSVYSVSITICSPELKKYKTHREIIEALRSLDYIYHINEE